MVNHCIHSMSFDIPCKCLLMQLYPQLVYTGMIFNAVTFALFCDRITRNWSVSPFEPAAVALPCVSLKAHIKFMWFSGHFKKALGINIKC